MHREPGRRAAGANFRRPHAGFALHPPECHAMSAAEAAVAEGRVNDAACADRELRNHDANDAPDGDAGARRLRGKTTYSASFGSFPDPAMVPTLPP
eukprot:NODE_11925_length_1257_cov_6.482301.p2 GENE.NODE_11925_length_1257_cov_6.482301~~NODE_11925_length_1257_cov_6.482301.p2  ORF type:complete len:96 (-),score=12.41 NODE_11925_length_1257_cov_6.482301:58-345(-)